MDTRSSASSSSSEKTSESEKTKKKPEMKLCYVDILFLETGWMLWCVCVCVWKLSFGWLGGWGEKESLPLFQWAEKPRTDGMV